jgi:hypothetical protein
MSDDFRYFDRQRKLSDELAEIKVAAPKVAETAPETEFSEGGLARIAQGQTALAGTPKVANGDAVEATRDRNVKLEETKRKLRTLVETKTASIDNFIADASELAVNPETKEP